MNSLRLINRQAGFVIAIAALFLSLVLPTLANAAQVTERSIELSSSSKEATGVSYTVKFKAAPVTTAGAFIIEFCSNSPLIPASCTAPTGFNAAGATIATADAADYTMPTPTANKMVITSAIAASEEVDFEITGITNPTAAGSLYARIVTYNTPENAALYASAALGSGVIDSGSVAISITNTIGVSAAVLESMVFCVSGTVIDANCSGTLTSTALSICETTAGVKALAANAISTGDIYTQLSTNASTGAVVNLKSSATGCGGLLRAGAPGACNIGPALLGGIAAGQAKFGVLVATSTDSTGVGIVPSGTYQPATGSGYNASTYALNYDEDQETGVTGVYGDPILDTAGAPVNNKNIKLTFGASVTNSTPAGLYSADLGLIATGKF